MIKQMLAHDVVIFSINIRWMPSHISLRALGDIRDALGQIFIFLYGEHILRKIIGLWARSWDGAMCPEVEITFLEWGFGQFWKNDPK